jgi:Cu/Ag efflux pump CusA
MDGAMIPLGQLARVVVAKSAPGIRTENALLSAYIYVDIRDRDIGSYVADAKKAVASQVKFPAGYYATSSGQFENMERAFEKMKVVIPVTLLSIFLLLYLKMTTVVAIMAGLLPILWGSGTGSEVMSRIAAPMVGGMLSSTVLTLAVIPAIYALVKQWRPGRGLEG